MFPALFWQKIGTDFPGSLSGPPRRAGKWRVPGSREVVWIDSREVFLRALPSDSNITYSSPPHPLCRPPPWTIFSTPLVAPSRIGTSGPQLLRVSVRFCTILSSTTTTTGGGGVTRGGGRATATRAMATEGEQQSTSDGIDKGGRWLARER